MITLAFGSSPFYRIAMDTQLEEFDEPSVIWVTSDKPGQLSAYVDEALARRISEALAEMDIAHGHRHFYGDDGEPLLWSVSINTPLKDVHTIALSTSYLMLLLGAGGAIWGGGSVGQAKGQGGPDVGIFLREWRLTIDVQAAYGSSHTYGNRQFIPKLQLG